MYKAREGIMASSWVKAFINKEIERYSVEGVKKENEENEPFEEPFQGQRQ